MLAIDLEAITNFACALPENPFAARHFNFTLSSIMITPMNKRGMLPKDP